MTLRLPADHVPGKTFRFVVKAGYLPGSPRQVFDVSPPVGHDPNTLVSLVVWLRVPSEEESMDEDDVDEGEEGDSSPKPPGVGAAKLRTWRVQDRAEANGLAYDPKPNDRNPVVAWLIMELGGFSNLKPEYFDLPERGRLLVFKQRFGFDSWADAMDFYEIAFKDIEPKTARCILHPRFQYLAALWRMKTYMQLDELATFFGVTRQTMEARLGS